MNYKQIKNKLQIVATKQNCHQLKAFFVGAYYLVNGTHGIQAQIEAGILIEALGENINGYTPKDIWLLNNIQHKLKECEAVIIGDRTLKQFLLF